MESLLVKLSLLLSGVRGRIILDMKQFVGCGLIICYLFLSLSLLSGGRIILDIMK